MSMSLTSPHQFEPGRPRSDLFTRQPTVLPEDGGNLSYSPHITVIDSSTKITSLELSAGMLMMPEVYEAEAECYEAEARVD